MKSVLAGFGALVVVMAGFITGVLPESLRVEVIAIAALFLIAGFLRGRAILVFIGAAVPLCIMAVTGIAFTSRVHLLFFLATALLASFAGAWTRRFWRGGNRGAALAVAGGCAGVAIATALIAVPAALDAVWTRRVSYPAPPFSFRASNGAEITNDSLRGRAAVFAFWATWCGPCREELPRLDAVRRKYPDIAFLAVDDEPAAKAQAFFTNRNLSLPLAFGDRKTFGIQGLPALVIVDPRGNVRLVHTGYDAAEDLEGMVRGALAAERQ